MRGLVSDTHLSPAAAVHPISSHLFSAFKRLDAAPDWAWLLGIFAGLWQYVSNDAFTQLVSLVILASAADYWFGTKAARIAGQFDPRIAHAGFLGKMVGVVLLLLLRLVEGWIYAAGFIDSRGFFATMIGMALLAVDLQSMANRREALGQTPIPVLSHVINWIRTLSTPKSSLPPSPPDRDR